MYIVYTTLASIIIQKLKIMEPTRLPPKYQDHNRDRKSGGHRGQLSHSSQRIDQNDSAVGVGLARSLG